MHLHCCVRPSKYAPVTHVIFDLDGTIIDSESVYCKALKEAVESYGREYNDNFISKVQGCVEMDVARTAIQTFDLDIEPKEFVDTYNGFSNAFLGDLDLMQGAERLIRHLHKHNIPLAVATSSSQRSYDLKTNKYAELFSAFHHIVCGGSDPEVTRGKPFPDIFLLAASRFDNPPEPSKCLIFEDSKNGLQAGLAAGMQVVMLPDHSMPHEIWKLATLRLDSFNYIMPELFGLPSFPEEEMAPEFLAINAPPIEPELPVVSKDKEPVVDSSKKEVTIAMEDEDIPETDANADVSEEAPEMGGEMESEEVIEETPDEEIEETPEAVEEGEAPETVEETPEAVEEETPEEAVEETTPDAA